MDFFSLMLKDNYNPIAICLITCIIIFGWLVFFVNFWTCIKKEVDLIFSVQIKIYRCWLFLVGCSSSLWFPIFWTHFTRVGQWIPNWLHSWSQLCIFRSNYSTWHYQKSHLPSTWAWPILCLQGSTFQLPT